MADWLDLINANNQRQFETPQQQASTDLTNAQTQSVQLANAKTQMILRALQGPAVPMSGPGSVASVNSALNPDDSADSSAAPSGSATPAAASGGGLGDYGVDDESAIYNQSRRMFQVINSWTPQELAGLQRGAQLAALGDDGMLKSVQTMHATRIQNAAAQAQAAARQHYDSAYAVATSPDGYALATLKNINDPSMNSLADRIEQHVDNEGWDDDKADGYVRSLMTTVGKATFPYAGQEFEVGKDGIARSKTDNRVVLGGTPEGLSASQKADIVKDADTMVDGYINGAASKMPKWQAAMLDQGVQPSRTAYIHSQISMAEGTPISLRTLAPSLQQPQPQSNSPQAQPQTPNAAPSSARAAPPSPAQPRGQQPKAPQPPAYQFDFSDAPARPSYMTIPNGRAPNEAEKAQQSDYVKAQTALLQDANQSSAENQRALLESQRMLNLLPNAKVGPGSQYLAKLQNSWAMLTGEQASDMIEGNATAYSILAKKLGQQALDEQLAKLKSDGAQVRLGAQESGLILNTLSASPEMGKGAIQSLLNWQIGESRYELRKAAAVPQYLKAGKDATQFETYYQQKNPLSANAPTRIQPATTVPTAKADASGYITGRLYPGANGTKARYQGNGQWQPE